MNLWMRWVDFRKLRDLLFLVAEHDGRLRPKDLDRQGIAHGILVTKKGQPSGASNRYHHRRMLERLGLVFKCEGRYTVNRDVPESNILLQSDAGNQGLEPKKKAAFAELLLRNSDCFHVFFRHFLKDSTPRSLSQFLQGAQPIRLSLHRRPENHEAYIEIEPSCNGHRARFVGENALQAIHFGMRTWCVEQLSFMDELYRTGVGYTLFAKQIAGSMTDDELAARMLDQLEFEGDWATVRVGDFILATAIHLQIGIDRPRRVLEHWLNCHRGVTAGIATRERFILGPEASRLHAAVLRGFAHPNARGSYISHIQVHKDILRT